MFINASPSPFSELMISKLMGQNIKPISFEVIQVSFSLIKAAWLSGQGTGFACGRLGYTDHILVLS